MKYLLSVYILRERCNNFDMAPCTLPANPLFCSEADKLTFEAIVKSLSVQHGIICNLEILHPQYRAVGSDFVLLLTDYDCVGLKSKVDR